MPTCRPGPWTICTALEKWGGDKKDLGQIIWTDEIWLTHKSLTSDHIHRLETTPRAAMLNRQVFGYVGEILEKLLGGIKQGRERILPHKNDPPTA